MESLQKLKQFCSTLVNENERLQHREIYLNRTSIELMSHLSVSLGCDVKLGEDVMSNYMVIMLKGIEFKIINEAENRYSVDVDAKTISFDGTDDLINFIKNYNDISSSHLSYIVTYNNKQCEFRALGLEQHEEKCLNTFILGYIGNHKYGIQIFNLYHYYSMDLVIDSEVVPLENIRTKSRKIEDLVRFTYVDLDKLIVGYNELAYLLLKNTPRLIICRIITQRIVENDCILRQLKSSWESKQGYIKLSEVTAVCITGFSFMLYDINHKQLGYRLSTNIDDAMNKIAMIVGMDIESAIATFEKIQ